MGRSFHVVISRLTTGSLQTSGKMAEMCYTRRVALVRDMIEVLRGIVITFSATP